MTEKKLLSGCEKRLKEAIEAQKIEAFNLGKEVDKSIEDHKRSESEVSHKDWFIENFGNDIGYSTAMKYRRIYKTCVDRLDWVLTFSLSTLHNLCAKGCPEGLRKHLLENGNPKFPNTAYKQVMEGIRDGIYDLHSPEVQALCRFDEKRDEFAERKKEERSLMVDLRNDRHKILVRSEQVEKSTLSEEGKRMVKESNEKIKEQIDIQLDAYKNQSHKLEFRLPKKTLKLKRNSQN